MAGFENSSISNLNPHLNATSLDLQVNLFRSCVLCSNVLFGPPTHVYVLWLIVTGGRIVSEFLNLNLSICEMTICVNYFISLLAIRVPEVYSFNAFTAGFCITGRSLFQCLMCVERYLAVVHPVIFLKYKPLRYKLFCSAAVWITALSSCLFCMFTAFKHINVYMWCFLLQFLLFLSVNLFCSLAVLWALKKPGPGERAKERKYKNHMKRRAFYLILIITVTMVTMFVPVIIGGFLFLFLPQYVPILTSFSLLCFILPGFVQPVLYLHQVGKLPFFCWTWSFINVFNLDFPPSPRRISMY